MIADSFKLFKKQVLMLLILLVIGWVISPYPSYFIGANIGLIVSFYCMWILGRKIERLLNNIVTRKKVSSLGMLNRAAAAILGSMLMYEYGHHIAMWTFATGILGGYFLFVINLAYYSQRSAKQELLNRKKSHYIDR